MGDVNIFVNNGGGGDDGGCCFGLFALVVVFLAIASQVGAEAAGFIICTGAFLIGIAVINGMTRK